MSFVRFFSIICLFVLPNAAWAYIGPGAGLSAIGTAIAVIGAFFLLILGFVWYPVKRMLRKRQAPQQAAGDTVQSDDAR